MPSPEDVGTRVVRINDGNDSSVNRELVMRETQQYPMRFYNTSDPVAIGQFDAPVVLTVNPGSMTDTAFVRLVPPIPPNLMFVRVRTNTWNLAVVRDAVKYYSAREVPIVLTFMAYFDTPIRAGHESDYVYRKRTLNSYWAITTLAWQRVIRQYEYNKWVYSCGKIEGELGTTACRHCGNCLREYFATIERMRK